MILVLVCACVGGGVGVWGGVERVAMKWLGVGREEAIAPLFRGRDERISGRMRGLVGD
jgi:hypothetical protein